MNCFFLECIDTVLLELIIHLGFLYCHPIKQTNTFFSPSLWNSPQDQLSQEQRGSPPVCLLDLNLDNHHQKDLILNNRSGSNHHPENLHHSRTHRTTYLSLKKKSIIRITCNSQFYSIRACRNPHWITRSSGVSYVTSPARALSISTNTFRGRSIRQRWMCWVVERRSRGWTGIWTYGAASAMFPVWMISHWLNTVLGRTTQFDSFAAV